MVKISEPIKGCRYWGYEPACAEYKDAYSEVGREKVREYRDQLKREIAQIKALGHKSYRYGMSKIDAHNQAEHVENQTGVNMRIFNHDYL